MVAVGEAEPGVVPVGRLLGDHEGGGAGAVGLEGEDHQVAHQAEVLVEVLGHARGPGEAGAGERRPRRRRCWMRRSTSRTPVRYWSSLRRSVGATRLADAVGVVQDVVEHALAVEVAVGDGRLRQAARRPR